MKLDDRLLAVANCVPCGAYLADVGTDHGYLPIWLAEKGVICGAVASDIHKAPLDSADKNIRENGFSSLIHTVLTDGLQGLEGYPVTDIAIAGMGGMMIKGILEKAPFVKERRLRLILQPMQHIPDLRKYLYENGFAITKETQATADGKFYQIICAVYCGIPQMYTETDLLLGQYNITHRHENMENFSRLCQRQTEILHEKIRGLEKGGYDTQKEKALYAGITELMKG